MMIPLPFLLSFLAASAVGFIIVLVITSKQSKKRDRMRELIISRTNTGFSGVQEQKDKTATPQSKHNLTKQLKKVESRAEAQKNRKSLTSLIGQAGYDTPLWRFWIYSFIFGSICFFPVYKMDLNFLVKSMLCFTFYFGLPRFYLKFKATRRQRAFLQDFANALEDMIRLLKAGMPVTEAISMVAREYTGPVGVEMQRVYDMQRVGTPLPEAVEKMTIRLPLAEVQMFATTIAIQVQTGSSLSEVLGNLATVIRGRYALKRKIVALSSEAKISAMIIGSLPFLVGSGLYLVNTDYIMLLFEHPTGQTLLGVALGMMGTGVIVMRQMINFKV